MTALQEMELSKRIYDTIEAGNTEGHGWNAEQTEGLEFSEPTKIVWRIYHADGYCMEVQAEMMVEDGEDMREYDELMLSNGWCYYVHPSSFDGFKDGTIEQVAAWIGITI